MRRSEKKSKKKTRRSLYTYILWNIILMLLLIILMWVIFDQIIENRLVKMILDETVSANPSFTRDEASDILFGEKYGGILNALTSPDVPEDAKKLFIDYVDANNKIVDKYLPLMYIYIGADLVLMVWLFVWKMKKRVVRELGGLDSAVSKLADISAEGENDGVVIISELKEFDRICDNINRISNSLTESEKQRAELEAARVKMLADISHDLKTPITVIQGYAKAINDGITDDETQRRYLNLIYKKSTVVTELINTFHEYSKLDHPDFQPVRSRGDLCEFFREYLAIKYEELDLAGYVLDADLPDEPIRFSYDEGQLRRVFDNLLSNCLKYNPAGTTLYAAMRENGDAIVIYLGDDGTGIPEDVRPKIFEPFVVGTESRSDVKGSGLGLAICKKIVEAHGGRITLADSPDWSTLYEITFYR